MTDRVIEEVDSKFENQQIHNQNIISSIYAELSGVDRNVNKILSTMKHSQDSSSYMKNLRKPQKNYEFKESLIQPEQNPKNKYTLISKYNYYGKKYRFQEKIEQLTVPEPEIKRSCITEHPEKQFKHNNKPSLSEIGDKEQKMSINAQIGSNNVFFDDGRLRLPSHNYYIYFDEQKKREQAKNIKQQESQQKKQPQDDRRFKPAWFLQKKINSLHKQVKKLKEKDKMVQKYGMSATGMSKTLKRDNVPINLKSNLEKMIDTLWI